MSAKLFTVKIDANEKFVNACVIGEDLCFVFRSYQDRPLSEAAAEVAQAIVEKVNREK